MALISEIITEIEEYAPPELASDWDNSGWQINLNIKETKKIMLALSPSLEVVEQAIKSNCDIIISHHPMIMPNIKKLIANNSNHLAIIKAIKNNVQVYSAHTNLDKTSGGLADKMMELLEIKDTKNILEFVKVGELDQPVNINKFIEIVKKAFKIDNIKLTNHANKQMVKRIAVCPGSGSDLASKLTDIDVYISGDIKYHHAIDVDDKAIIDAGHYGTERIILPTLKELLSGFDIEILIADESQPWVVV